MNPCSNCADTPESEEQKPLKERLDTGLSFFGELFSRDFVPRAGAALLLAGLATWLAASPETLSALPPALAEHIPETLYIAAVVLAGWGVYPAGLKSLFRLRPDMFGLMTIAAFGAMALGEFWEAVIVMILLEFAEFLEDYAKKRSNANLGELLQLKPETARRVTESGDREELPADEVGEGELVEVIAGEKIPLDGNVSEGTGAVNEAPLTGESVPVDKQPGDEVYAGTLLENGTLVLEVTAEAGDSKLDQVAKLLAEARSNRTEPERAIDRFALWYTPAILGVAALIALVPPALGIAPIQLSELAHTTGNLWQDWMYRGLVVLVIGCPCALVISAPVAVVNAVSDLAMDGVLTKGGGYLELLSQIEAFAFDKTGTLTTGDLSVSRVHARQNMTEEELVALVMALERESTHPIARAIFEYGEQRGIEPGVVEQVETVGGKGLVAQESGTRVAVGSHEFIHEMTGCDEELHVIAERESSDGESVVMVAQGESVLGLISLADTPRENIAPVLQEIRELTGARLELLTGDHMSAAQLAAGDLPLDGMHAGLLPEEKIEHIERLKRDHGKTAMVGDGINDAPSLSAADLGISMAGVGTDLAVDSAQVILMDDRLEKIPEAIRKSRATLGIIGQNVWGAIGIKAAVLVLAVLGMASMWMAILADMGATLLVTANSFRLHR